MPNFRWTLIALLSVLPVGTAAFPRQAAAQSQTTRAFVGSIVNHELKADAADHSKWMYLDSKTSAGKNTVSLVVETSQGDLSKTIDMDGRPLTAQQRTADEQKMQRFVTTASVRQKQKQNQENDDKQAVALTKMLPDGFLWTKTGVSGDETTLSFKPDPKFNPPSHEAEVFSAMQGTMVVNTKDKRIKSLQGTLMKDVTFGWFGILGKLRKGGTFQIERRPVGNGVWMITETKIHIHGHELFFKTISTDESEEKSHFKPAPPSITLAQARMMLNDGEVAKDLGIATAH